MSLNLRAEDKGILPDRMIHALLETGAIIPEIEPDEDQVQPASIDLRLGAVAYRARGRASCRGRDATVAERIDELKLHEILLGDVARNRLRLHRARVAARKASRSSFGHRRRRQLEEPWTGRLDVFTRVIADATMRLRPHHAGYHGPLYAEDQSPRTFPVCWCARAPPLADQVPPRSRRVDRAVLRLLRCTQSGERLADTPTPRSLRSACRSASSISPASPATTADSASSKRHMGFGSMPTSRAIPREPWEPIKGAAEA